MSTTSVTKFTESIETDCAKHWGKVASKAGAMALIWQAEIRKEVPVVSHTLQKGIFVYANLLALEGFELQVKTSVPYFWCVNYGHRCPHKKTRTPQHFLETATDTALPLVMAVARGVK